MLVADFGPVMRPVDAPGDGDGGEPGVDPLEGFLVEPGGGASHPVDLQRDAAPAPMPPAVAATDGLERRLTGVERAQERTSIELSALRSDLATLVGVLDDIKTRQSRNAEPPPVVPLTAVPRPTPVPRRSPAPKMQTPAAAAAAAAVLVMTLAVWAALSIASYSLPESSSSDVAAAEPVSDAQPSPAGDVMPTTMALQKAAAVSEVERPAPEPKRASPTPARPEPRRPVVYVGTLTIDSSPAGDVFVNRKKVGRTPVRVERLRAGSHLIWIEREGYRRWTRVVPVAADRVSRVTADLDPLKP